jgi:hypothetical protein
MMRSSAVFRLLETSARTSPLARRRPRAAKTGGLVHCGLVLQKIDGRSFAVFHEADVYWRDRAALAKDVADVMIAMSDPGASGWEALVEQVRALASTTSVYFSDVSPNPAREEFLAEWELVRTLA